MNFELFIYYGNWIWKSKVRSATFFFFLKQNAPLSPIDQIHFLSRKKKRWKLTILSSLFESFYVKKEEEKIQEKKTESFWQWLCPLYLLLSIKFSNSPSAVLVPFQCWVFVLFSERFFFQKNEGENQKKRYLLTYNNFSLNKSVRIISITWLSK